MTAAADRPIYAPTVADLCAELPGIGRSVAQALELLGKSPSVGSASQVAAQLAGAQAYVQRLRQALNREAPDRLDAPDVDDASQ